MTKVLHVISSMSAGGIESFVVSLYKNIDRENFHFDFAVFNPNNPIHENTLKEMGANVYYIADAGCNTTKLSKIMWRFKAIKNFYKLIRKNKYDAVHCHNYGNFSIYVLLARLCGIKKTIVHSHTAGGVKETKLTYLIRRIKNIFGFEWLVTDKIGCSNLANDWLYGKDSVANGKAKTMYNGVDMNKFSRLSYPEKSVTLDKYGLDNKLQFVSVGRISTPKNQIFMIEIFDELRKLRNDVHLNMVGMLGYGELEEKIKETVEKKGLNEYVSFFPFDTNVPELLSACDFFLLPSLWEGLPVVAIEAQSMELPIYISDKVTKEVDMGLAKYLPIDNGAQVWAEEIHKDIENGTYPKELDPERVKIFDMKNVAREFEKMYKD